MIRQIAPQFFTTDMPATLAYYRDALGFDCLGTWHDPPVYAIVARDGQRREIGHMKRRRVVVMIVFMIISFGLYYPVWWFRRRAALNRLNASKKVPMWPLLLLGAFFALQFGIGFVAGETPLEEILGEGGVLLLALFRLAVAIVMLIQSFRVKDIIEEHATPDATSGPTFVEQVQLSGLMTFFFSIFYLQWAINRYVVGEQPAVSPHH